MIQARIFCLLFFLPCLFSIHISAQNQDACEVYLGNEHVKNGAYYFDIFLRQSPNSAKPIYLGDADFVVSFDDASFVSPSLEKVGGDTPKGRMEGAFCTFSPVDGASSKETLQLLRQFYFSNTVIKGVNGTLAVINLLAPNLDPKAFPTQIAKIDQQHFVHRLGRFRITGYQGGNPGLKLDFTSKLKTLIFSIKMPEPERWTEPNVYTEIREYQVPNAYDAATQLISVSAPVNQKLTLSNLQSQSQDFSYALEDWNNKVWSTGPISASKGSTEIDLKALPAGNYRIRIIFPGGTQLFYHLTLSKS